MTIPNLPTDNLYKFVALSGITIILLSVFFYSSKLFGLREEIDSLKSESQLLTLEIDFLEEDLENNKLESDSLRIDTLAIELTIPNLNEVKRNKELMEYYDFVFKYEDKFHTVYRQLELVTQEKDRLKLISRDIKRKFKQIELKGDSLQEKYIELILMTVLLLALCMVGFMMAKYGFNQWYKKIQKPLDKKILSELRSSKLGMKKKNRD